MRAGIIRVCAEFVDTFIQSLPPEHVVKAQKEENYGYELALLVEGPEMPKAASDGTIDSVVVWFETEFEGNERRVFGHFVHSGFRWDVTEAFPPMSFN